MAKIEDDLKAGHHPELIICIDDPVSGLDNTNIYFMYHFIESVIAKPEKYTQLFISTHNLEFLNHLKQLIIPQNKQTQKSDVNYYTLSRITNESSQLSLMPADLKE